MLVLLEHPNKRRRPKCSANVTASVQTNEAQKAFRFNFAKPQQVWLAQVATHSSEAQTRLRASSAPHVSAPRLLSPKTNGYGKFRLRSCPPKKRHQPLEHCDKALGAEPARMSQKLLMEVLVVHEEDDAVPGAKKRDRPGKNFAIS